MDYQLFFILAAGAIYFAVEGIWEHRRRRLQAIEDARLDRLWRLRQRVIAKRVAKARRSKELRFRLAMCAKQIMAGGFHPLADRIVPNRSPHAPLSRMLESATS